MSAPVIVSTSPAAGEADVVLGRPVEIVFDQPVDPATVTAATFSLMGPGQTAVVDADEIIVKNAQPQTGREYIPGRFSFPAPERLLFTPERPLRPNVEYTVLIVGKGSLLAKSYVANPAGEALARSLQFKFKTGEIDQADQPVGSPLAPAQPWEKPALHSTEIRVSARKVVGNNLQEIELVFPADIDPNSFRQEDLLVSLEPFLNDPSVAIPDSASCQVTISGNRITIRTSL
jgi:hypothetical protein